MVEGRGTEDFSAFSAGAAAKPDCGCGGKLPGIPAMPCTFGYGGGGGGKTPWTAGDGGKLPGRLPGRLPA